MKTPISSGDWHAAAAICSWSLPTASRSPAAIRTTDLPEALQACVAESASGLADLICNLDDDELANDACGRAGLEYVTTAFSNERLDAAMRQVLGPAVANT